MGAAVSYTLEDAVDYFAIYGIATDNLTTHQVDLRLDGKQFVFHHSDLWGTRLYDKRAKKSHTCRDLVEYTRRLFECADVPYARQTIQASIWNDHEVAHFREMRFNLAFLPLGARYHASSLLRKTLFLLKLEPQDQVAKQQVIVTVPVSQMAEVKEMCTDAMGDLLTWTDFAAAARLSVGKN